MKYRAEIDGLRERCPSVVSGVYKKTTTRDKY